MESRRLVPLGRRGRRARRARRGREPRPSARRLRLGRRPDRRLLRLLLHDGRDLRGDRRRGGRSGRCSPPGRRAASLAGATISSATSSRIAGGAAIASFLLHNSQFIRRFQHLDQRANQHQAGTRHGKLPPAPSGVRRGPHPLGRDHDRRRARGRNGRVRRRPPFEEAAAPAVLADRLAAGGLGRARRLARRPPQRARPAPRDHRRVRADGDGARRRRPRRAVRRRRRSSTWSGR